MSGEAATLTALRAGRIDYEAGLALQQELERRRIADELGDQVIVLEHPPVITLGHRGDERNVLASERHLAALGIAVHRTSRGGDVTYHGPGQVVLYPVVSLTQARLGQAAFVELLEEVMIGAAAAQGVRAERVEKKRGVFVGGEKLGAVGIHVSRGVTTHGLALNVDPDLAHFELIVPCGLREHGVTSLRRAAGRPVDQEAVARDLLRGLAEGLGRRLVDVGRGGA